MRVVGNNNKPGSALHGPQALHGSKLYGPTLYEPTLHAPTLSLIHDLRAVLCADVADAGLGTTRHPHRTGGIGGARVELVGHDGPELEVHAFVEVW